jgi:hypothetical protein
MPAGGQAREDYIYEWGVCQGWEEGDKSIRQSGDEEIREW